MTSERDFDRIARAWLDLGPNEAPDRAVDAVLQAVETTPQVRRPIRLPFWRPVPMSRLPMLALLAGLIIIVVGALALSSGSPGPGPSATPSPVASATPSFTPGPIPAAINGGWTAASRGTAIEDTETTTIAFGPSMPNRSAPEFRMYRADSAYALGSAVVEASPGVLRLESVPPDSTDCEPSSSGSYRWSLSEDGQWLALELIDDGCEVRADVVSGTWQRNLAFSSNGGPGVATNFEPFVIATLPTVEFRGFEFNDTDTIWTERDDGAFLVWKDVDGFQDPCDIEQGRLDIAPGMDAFLAYLEEDPRFAVTRREETQLDGQPAVEIEFTVSDAIVAPCWDGGVLTYIPQAQADQAGHWAAAIDSTKILVVTEVDGATLVVESTVIEDGLTQADRATLDSIRFLDVLPTPPAS